MFLAVPGMSVVLAQPPLHPASSAICSRIGSVLMNPWNFLELAFLLVQLGFPHLSC